MALKVPTAYLTITCLTFLSLSESNWAGASSVGSEEVTDAPFDFHSVDVSELGSPATAPAAADVIREACETHGLFFVTGHGLSPSDLRTAFAAADAFFNLPQHVKQSIPIDKGGFTRGFVPLGGESGSDLLEVKEAFSLGYNWSLSIDGTPRNPLQGLNRWPPLDATPVGWRDDMITMYNRLVDVAEKVTQGLSLALGFPADFLASHCTDGRSISLLRLFHYMRADGVKAAESAGTGVAGSSPHTDWGFLTLIAQDTQGLELHDPVSKQWVKVPAVDGSLVVNVGDYLSILTGGKFISPLHRVVETRGAEGASRTSFVLFYYPSFESRIAPLVTPNEQVEQRVSLLKNQRVAGDASEMTMGAVSKLAFGEYILSKWQQVFRAAPDEDVAADVEAVARSEL